MTRTEVRRVDAAREHPRDAAARWQLRAWVSLALTPVGLVVAMLVGEGLLAAQGYDTGGDVTLPLRVVLLAAVPALLVGVAAPAVTCWSGVRAHRAGHPRGLVVAVAGAVLGIGFICLNVLAALVGG